MLAQSAPLSAEDRVAIVDTLYRFAGGQDDRDPALLESAFAQDAVLDFTQPAAALGVDIAPFAGRAEIVDVVMTSTAPLDTTHSVSNPRVVSYDGSRARLVALVEAQHLVRGHHARHLLLKNKFDAELVRESGGWVIRSLRIQNIWRTGCADVLFPAAPA